MSAVFIEKFARIISNTLIVTAVAAAVAIVAFFSLHFYGSLHAIHIDMCISHFHMRAQKLL